MCVALALGGQASVAAAKPWFRETDIATITPSVAGCGKASHKPRDIGGEATAVFDVNGDRIPDIVIVNGTDYYFVALGHRNPNGSVSYPKEATPYPIGVAGDGHIEKSKALGLTDFNRDGKLDLYIGNSGDGSLDLKNPRDLANAYNPANLDTSHLCEYHGYRTYLNKGNGTFAYKNLGADVNGDTRTRAVRGLRRQRHSGHAGVQRPLLRHLVGQQRCPKLAAARHGETVRSRANILRDAIVGAHGQPERNLFQNQYGQAIVDVKGAVVRDFDGDGKPDVIAAAYSDVWDGIQKPTARARLRRRRERRPQPRRHPRRRLAGSLAARDHRAGQHLHSRVTSASGTRALPRPTRGWDSATGWTPTRRCRSTSTTTASSTWS